MTRSQNKYATLCFMSNSDKITAVKFIITCTQKNFEQHQLLYTPLFTMNGR